jgi:anaerobic magnesium-protoporphyrin IX monomethyl ester cyclase
MDILLTHGYFIAEDAHEQEIMRPYPPLGILYISSYLKAHGYAVELFDSTFNDLDTFNEYIQRERPPVVGIYTNMMTRRNVLRMIPMCKAVGAKVILGGPDPANYAENFLDFGADVVVIGEGELALDDLLPALAKNADLTTVPGIVFSNGDGDIVRTEPRAYIKDLNVQPFPDRAAIDIPQYMQTWKTHHGQSAVSLITARGCPYKCNWCSHAVFGYTHRRRSPQNVVDEVAQIKATYNPDLLWYADDVFTINHRWLFKYAEELTRRDLHTPFETISREDRLNEDVVRTLAEMGCYRIWVGAESGSQRILDAMERQTNVERVIEVVRLLQKYGIEAGMFIMLGYDGEEKTDLEATVDVLKRANPDVFLTTVAYPIAGTKFFEKVEDRIIPMKAWEHGSDSDYTVAGRHSRRYYRHATRWMVGEVELHRQRSSDLPNYKQMAKAFVNANAGRLGMRLSRHEVESGQM